MRLLCHALVVLAASVASGQADARISSLVACSGCTIRVERLVAVGDAEGPGMVHEQGLVVLDRAGRTFVTSNGDPGRIRVFGSDGKHLTTFGRSGLGPGEFRDRPLLRFAGDGSFNAIDIVGRRLTRFTPDFKVAATTTLPLSPSDATFVGESLVAVGGFGAREGALVPLHVIGANGEVGRSFGAAPEGVEPSVIGLDRRIAPAVPSGVWVAHRNRYLIEHWGLDGKKTLTLRRDADWFAPWSVQSGPPHRARPDPTIREVRQDQEGRLWVLIRVADANWQPRALTPYGGNPGLLYFPGAHEELAYDSIIEVLDPRTGRLSASVRFPQYFLGFGSTDTVTSYEEDASGNPRYVVWRLRFEGRPGATSVSPGRAAR
jgi:hypothetical protein